MRGAVRVAVRVGTKHRGQITVPLARLIPGAEDYLNNQKALATAGDLQGIPEDDDEVLTEESDLYEVDIDSDVDDEKATVQRRKTFTSTDVRPNRPSKKNGKIPKERVSTLDPHAKSTSSLDNQRRQTMPTLQPTRSMFMRMDTISATVDLKQTSKKNKKKSKRQRSLSALQLELPCESCATMLSRGHFAFCCFIG